MADQDTQRTTAVLLAAGAGTRLGRGPKALLRFRGRTLVEVLADVLLAGGCREVVAVIGADAATVRAVADLSRHRVIENPDWATGMGSSFRAGVAAAAPEDHVLIALVDQPGLTTETVTRLLASHRPGRVTAAAYRGPAGKLRRGHPLILDSSLRAEAAETATGDVGARHFLQAHPELIDLVDCSDLSGGDDLDTPEQLHLLQ
ncbi:NTP transferase domain-containing protein [Pseudarthrobacter psychrotolerans]|uniref:NTP transferase domain-containing protein n=1 Tax=Pseudarthrobacter psychrotolerans TaxID=2697569 RepID=A0A6P1NPL1_9MICC|nr:nucleotidyltransferase family protein [Pseudarthrobacter psychrotolerans]QHK20484.1 NTP transferase domain-containing protein [Pseudarthrobacter psychrotolerans]